MKGGGTRENVWGARFNRAAIGSFLLIAVLYAGEKPNGYSSPNLVNPVNPVRTIPVQQTFAEKKQANWNVRGAWKDSFWLDFEDGWLFPHGTNHLTGVEVVSFGQVWATPFDTNAVASAGAAFEIVRGLSSFACEFTPSNSCRVAWTDAALGRDTNALVSAALELFRNGDVAVTTNGVTTTRPRALPFPHNGFGQDAEWVAANFTNATEILAVGYPNWVDAQVGEGLTNGLYKLTVTVAEDPPETTRLGVGGLSVAVTNAGEYVFLLEKGEAYGLSFLPPSTNIAVSAVDDVPTSRSAWGWGDGGDGIWSVDVGGFVCDYALGMPSALCWWLPSLCGAPDLVHVFPETGEVEFSAVLFDCPRPVNAAFEWSVSEGLVAETPHAQSTRVTVGSFPSWSGVSMSVSVAIGSLGSLVSTLDFSVGTNSAPQAGVSLSVPRTMFANDDDDNRDGTNDYERVDFGIEEDDVVKGTVLFDSDVITNGTIRISVDNFPGDVYTDKNPSAAMLGGFDVAVEGESWRTVDVYFNPCSWSPCRRPSVTAVWIPEGGAPQTSSVPFTVVKPVAEPICAETEEHSALGTNHVYTLNPCGVAVGDDAYFRVQVSPTAFPDSEIVWANGDGRIEFVGGNTGRSVHVRGVSAGETTLEVIIGGRTQQAPTFPLRVVTPQTFKITAWIVSDENNKKPREISAVQDMIAPLNDIYRQVGVSFYLDSVTVTNIPGAYSLLYDSTTNDVWNFGRLVDIGHGTGGIECYFVNDLFCADGSAGPVGANSSGGIVLTARASAHTLAHEIGHAFGLKDIYAANTGIGERVPPGEEKSVGLQRMCFACSTSDWNGGCGGSGEGGCRYYPSDTRLYAVLYRLLMYGQEMSDEPRSCDITHGNVRGVWYDTIGNSKIWDDDDAPVGFFVNLRRKNSPAHE